VVRERCCSSTGDHPSMHDIRMQCWLGTCKSFLSGRARWAPGSIEGKQCVCRLLVNPQVQRSPCHGLWVVTSLPLAYSRLSPKWLERPGLLSVTVDKFDHG
jgi:hypothetical protein